jgi:HEAT repeat protein
VEELLERLRAMKVFSTEWEYLLSPRWRVLDRAGRAFVEAKFENTPALRTRAEEVWGLLLGEPSVADVERCCAAVAHRPFAGASAKHLYRTALAHFAAALVAGHLRHPGKPGDLSALETWLGRFAGADQPLPPLRGAPGQLHQTDPGARVGALLPPPLATRLNLSLESFLGAEVPARFLTPTPRVKIAFPTQDDLDGSGGVFELELRELGAGHPDLYQDPECFAVPLADHWHDVIRTAYKRHSFVGPVVWCVRPVSSAAAGTQTLSGQSHTAAACVAFRALFERREVDQGCLITAWFGENNAADWAGDPELKAVGGLEAKCRAACECKGRKFSRILLNDPGFLPGQTQFGTRTGTIAIVRPSRLEQAYQDATGLISELRSYYAAAAAFIDQDRGAYLGERLLSELYIEPDVLRDIIRPEREPRDAMPGGSSTAETADVPRDERLRHVKLEATSEAEEKSRDKEIARRERVAWRTVWPQTRRAVIIGDPGEGKSILARHLLRELAQQALKELDAGLPVAQLTLPVFVRLSDLAETTSLDDAVRAAVNRLRPGGSSGFSEALVRHILGIIRESEKGTLILDGFDEVPSARHTQRQEHLQALNRLPCRVVLTSRPYGFQQGGVPFAQLDRFELAPLTPEHRRTFVAEWFRTAQRSDWQARVQQLVASPGLGAMAQNAFLLTLTCAEAEIRNLPQNARRPQIYFWIVRDLIRGAWKRHDANRSRPDLEPLEENDPGIAEQMGALKEVSWRLLGPQPARYAFTETEWFRAILGLSYSRVEARALLDAWQTRGVLLPLLVRHRGVDQPGWAFAHRSILEYLAAANVAELPDPVAAIERYLWRPQPDESLAWEPDAQELLQFVAGCMTDPNPLLSRLRHLERDRPDALFVMARLAGRCLADVDHTRLDPAVVSAILHRAHAAYSALGETKSLALPFQTAAGVSWLAGKLRAAAFGECAAWLKLVRDVGALAATPEVLRTLRDTVCNNDLGRDEAIRTLGALGSAAATPEVLRALVDRTLWGEGGSVRALGAKEALGALSAAAAPQVLHALVDRALSDGAVHSVRPRALRALGALGSAAATPAVLRAVVDCTLQDPSTSVRKEAVQALGASGSATRPEVLRALVDRALHDPSVDVRSAAAWALSSAAATPEVLRALVDRARHDESDLVRLSTARGLGALGPAAATPEVSHALVDRALHDASDSVRKEAVLALRALGSGAAAPEVINDLRNALHGEREELVGETLRALCSVAATPEVLRALIDCALRDERAFVRWGAARGLGALGSAAPPEVIHALVDRALHDGSLLVREGALGALGALGAVAATPEVLSALVDRARHDESNYAREGAAQGLGALGAAAVTPEVLSALVDCALRDGNEFVRRAALSALGALGAATPEVLRALVDRARHDESNYARAGAAQGLGALGAAAVTPGVLSALVDRARRDGREFVRRGAVEALGALGASAATPEVLQALVDRARRDGREFVRRGAVEALGALGASAATPEVLQALVDCALHDESNYAREGAVEALGALGAAAATPEVLTHLRNALADAGESGYSVRLGAVEALGALGASAATPEVLRALVERTRHDDFRHISESAAAALERFLNFRTFLPRALK